MKQDLMVICRALFLPRRFFSNCPTPGQSDPCGGKMIALPIPSWKRSFVFTIFGCILTLLPSSSTAGSPPRDGADISWAKPSIKPVETGKPAERNALPQPAGAKEPGRKTAGRQSSGQVLNLAQAVRDALDNDPRLYGSHWEAEAARHGANLAWRSSLPQLTTSGNYGYEEKRYYRGGPNDAGSDETGTDTATAEEEKKDRGDYGSETWKYGLDLSWTIFEFGAGFHRIGAARERAAGALLREERTRDIAIFDIVLAYFDLYRIRHLLTINQQNRLAHRELTRVVQARVKQNQAAEVRLQEAELRLHDLQMEREDLLAMEMDAVEAFRLVTGVEPGASLQEPMAPKLLPAFTANDVDGLVGQAERRHPELISLRKDIEAQHHDIEAARREHLPKVSVYSGYSYRANDYDTYSEGADYSNVEAGVKVSMPLFGQLINENVNAGVAKRESQIGRYNRLLLEVRRNVRVAVETILSLRERQGQLAENARAAAALSDKRGEQFKVQNMGDDGVLAMSNALQQRFRSEAACFNIRMKARLSAYSLEALIGVLVREFVDPEAEYTDMTAKADLATDVPHGPWPSRVDSERYNPLPPATAEADKDKVIGPALPVSEESKGQIKDSLPTDVEIRDKKKKHSIPPIGTPAKNLRGVSALPAAVVLPLAPNSNELTAEGKKEYVRFVKNLKYLPQAKLLVKGFVSSNTESPQNIKLSEERAVAVKEMLVASGRIESGRIQAKGMGIQEPIASNATSDGRAKNRRVEIVVVDNGR